MKLLANNIHKHQPIDIYHSRKREEPGFSETIIRFKNGDQIIVNKLCYLAVHALSRQNKTYDYIVRSLASDELVQEFWKPLDRLADLLHCSGVGEYRPDLIQKNKLTAPMRSIPHHQRFTHLRGIYKACTPFASPKSYLLIDDVFTSGATTLSIAEQLLLHNHKSTVDIFSIADCVTANHPGWL